MGFHHLALATRDLLATHRFYTEAVGFELVRVDVLDLPDGSWFRHVFYDTGNGELLTFFEIHDPNLTDFRTDISTGLGLPGWVNHIAFAALDTDDIEVRKERLLAHGHDCVVMDHRTALSLYADDPNGVTVEFCAQTRPLLTTEHRARAADLLCAPRPTASAAPPSMEHFSAAAR